MPADLARHVARRRGAQWRRLLYDPATGVATDLSPGYRPRPRTTAFVRARDGEQTRFPTSGATRLELDHVREYCHVDPPAGGPTQAGNLVAAGKRDHQLKTDRLVAVSGDANGALTYRTPSGREYVSHPYQYAAPAAGPARRSGAGPPPF
jgi:hypothetical protein